MAIEQESLVTTPSEQPAEAVALFESARRLILVAIAWWVVAELSSFPVGFAAGLVKRSGVPNAFLDNPISFTAMGFLASAIFLIADIKRSRIVGHGNHRAGVGDRRIMKWWLLIVLALLTATWAFFVAAVWNGLVPQSAASWGQASPWTVGAFAIDTVLLAPLAEELFFRGWLWTGLRRHWRVFPTALLTCGFWLVTHLDRGLLLPLFLLPIAVILGFARHFCGVRAAIILHAIYNFVVILVLLFLLDYSGRCSGAFDRNDYDRAIADCSLTIKLNPKLAPSYVTRGRAHARKGDFTLAIVDYTQAIEIDRKYAVAYEARANAWRYSGSFDLAIGDYTAAIRLNPKSAQAYYGRGLANLYIGATLQAASDLNQSNGLNPKNPYAAIWLEIARSRVQFHLPSLLKQETTEIDMTKWPAPVIRLFLGETSAAEVLAAADASDAGTKKGQVCEANFYSGQVELRKANKEEAVHLFQLAVADCPKSFDEFSAANAELKTFGMH
jgi:lipoprotein NlpI/membrane protease YdiL (CAAX protease family)